MTTPTMAPPPTLLHHPVPPFLHLNDGQHRAQLWIPRDLEQQGVFLRLELDNEERLIPMAECAPCGRFRLFGAPLLLDSANDQTVYTFKILCAASQTRMHNSG